MRDCPQLGLEPIGQVYTPFKTLAECPPSAWDSDFEAMIDIFESYRSELIGLDVGMYIFVIWWFDRAESKQIPLLRQPSGKELGAFAMRSPNRPNPLALSFLEVREVLPNGLRTSGLECIDGTFVFDIKPAIYVPQGYWI
jgi:tRNA-Thr(GGU) m(6)t(6)A37 methyltransferase TsaA